MPHNRFYEYRTHILIAQTQKTILGDFEPTEKEGERIWFVSTFEFDLEGREKSRKSKFFCLGAIPEKSERAAKLFSEKSERSRLRNRV